MATQLQCEPFAVPGQRLFWTTQPDACGTSDGCGINTECGRPGLSLQTTEDSATFASNDWVRSIALNMLLTDARRRDTRCGYVPGTLNGHWSESFAQGQPIGSHVRYVNVSTSVRDAVLLIKAEVRATLQKLVDYGIAIDVEVDTRYNGNGQIGMAITIYGTAVDPTRIGVTATRNDNSWAWSI